MAFSGGGDSLALLRAGIRRAAREGQTVHALIVDHQLHDGAAATAQRAAAIARAHGAQPHILRWIRTTDGGRGQARARAARHRLLAAACADLGARTLWLGHTADDQAETLLMRLARPAVSARSLSGLRPIAPSPAWPEGRDLLIARPLLATRRAVLRRELAEASAEWIDDPANENDDFERVRARGVVMAFSDQMIDKLGAIARRAQALDGAVSAQALAGLSGLGVDASGGLSLPADAMAMAPPAVRSRMLEALICAASGRCGALPGAQRDRLAAELGRTRHAATLCGAHLRWARNGVLRISPDPGVLHGRNGAPGLAPLQIPAGAQAIWDGRFLIGPHHRPMIVTPGASGGPAMRDDSGQPVSPPVINLAIAIVARLLAPHDPSAWRRNSIPTAWREPP